jgi:branched-chain amino acid transport system ATP-binding protein
MDAAAAMSPVLRVRQLEVVYNRLATAVQGVTIEVGGGDIVAVIGTNGAGKTTTLRAISGFLPAEDVAITDGSIEFEGRSITGWPPHRVSRHGIVLVPERDKLFETLTVSENLHFNLGRHNRDRLDEVYGHFPQLAERRDQVAGYLSGGEKQMLAIGMALLCQPRLLLVDELSLGLAPVITRSIMDILSRINRELALPMLIVEQNALAALSISTFGYVLEGGRVVFKAPAADLMQHGDIKEFYLGGTAEGEGYRNLRQYARKRRWWG